MANFLIPFAFVILFSNCQVPTGQSNATTKATVVATTGMLYDAVLNIGKNDIDAQVIMGPGVDPHLYKATQGDLARLTQADLIIYNGLYLEGKMGEILEQLSERKPVVAAAESIPTQRLLATTQFGHSYDPHVWFDVNLWKEVVRTIGNSLQTLDTAKASVFQVRTEAYLQKLDSLHETVASRIAAIPQEQRVLVTAHDAFGYFGEAYDMEVKGLQGISTVSDFGLKDIAEITDLVIDRKLAAIFVETSVSEKAINAVIAGCRARGHKVSIGGYLYSDAMGAFGTKEGTYLGMVDANVSTIVDGLRAETSPTATDSNSL